MPGEDQLGMQCSEFDALLGDAIDQMLSGQQLALFQAHARTCQLCGPLWAEAEEGKRLLQAVTAVEPPAHLVHKILAATSGIQTAAVAAQPQPTWIERAREWGSLIVAPVWSVVRQPRFAMSFGMAFFSLSVALSMAGVKITDVSHLDLRPSAIKRTYYETSGRVVKYYENIRFVYEIESRMREIKRATTPAEPAPQNDEKRDHKNNTSGQPEQKQERNYSRGDQEPVFASLPDALPEMWFTTTRRNS